VTPAGPGPAVLCLDVGGSSVKSGVVLASGELIAGPFRKDLDSTGPAGPVVAALASSLEGLLPAASAFEVVGVGVSMPGPCDYEQGVPLMRGLGKFESLYGLDLAAEVTKAAPALAGLRWRWLNDAQAFGLGELRFGAGRGADRVLFLTLGTGCGSAFAVGGRLVTSGEWVPEGGFVYALTHGEHKVDELLSARGVLRQWRAVAGDEASVRTAADVGALAEAGDPRALEAFARFGRVMAEALGPVFRAFQPDLVVLGGRVSRSLRFFGPAAMDAGAPPLRPAEAPDEAALRGAAAHLLEGKG
jgi:glucokinase